MTLHKLTLTSHNLFNSIYSKKYIELKGNVKYNVGDSVWLRSYADNSEQEGFLTVFKVKYDKVNDITFIDFKRDRGIERKKTFLQKVKDFFTF